MQTPFLFSHFRRSATPAVRQFDATTADYIAGLIAGFINRAAVVGSFRGAIASHPHMTLGSSPKGTDIGHRPAYGLTATAQTKQARIAATGADAGRLAFLGFAPVHKKMNAISPVWSFEEKDVTMRTHSTIIDVGLDVACMDTPQGAAIELTLTSQT